MLPGRSLVLSLGGFLAKIGGAAISLLYFVLLGRALSVSDVGYVMLGIASITFGSVIIRLGSDHALVRALSQMGSDSLDRLNVVNNVLGVLRVVSILSLAVSVFALALVFVLGLISTLNVDVYMASAITFFAILPITYANIVVAVMNGLGRNVSATLFQSALQPAIALLLTAIVFYGFGALSANDAAICYLLAAWVLGIVSAVCCKAVLGSSAYFSQSKFRQNSILMYGVSLLPASIADIAITTMPVILIGMVGSPVDVALLAMPMRIAALVFFVYASISTVFSPRIGKMAATESFEKVIELFRLARKFMFLSVGIVSLVVGFFGEFVLSTFGAEYVAAIDVLYVLLLVQVVHAVFGPSSVVLIMYKKQAYYTTSMIGGALVTCIATLVLGSFWGAIGAACGVLLGTVAQKGASFFFMHRFGRKFH